ncbi:MAG: hypothetical protein A3K59_04830 [Euryarchaeota archaeon RBG_19FT_COMBO_69_17]|nr:MAG: hypothetical protein A3K59_04830 [Euryarchaeota archaeon RBG_19FT_COMBO_69_17]
MRAVFFRRFGLPDVFEEGDLPTPEPGPGEIRLKVIATALNHFEVWTRAEPGEVPMPHVGGSDILGVVDKVGRGVKVRVGTRGVFHPGWWCTKCRFCRAGEEHLCKTYGLIGEVTNGGLAEYAVAPARNFVRVPDALQDEVAAAYPLTSLTAYRMLVTKGRLRRGETVLVHGAGGGLSSIGIQIARALGARVLATTKGAEKAAKARTLGAQVVIDYAADDVLARVMEATKGEGVDLVFENVGRATFETSLKALRNGGRIVTAGAHTGREVSFTLGDLYWYQKEILGSSMGGPKEFAAVSRLVFAGKIRPVIDRVVPLSAANVRTGHEALEAGTQFGKIVFRVS